MLAAITTTGWVVLIVAGLITVGVLVTLILFVVDRFKQNQPQKRKR